MHADTSSSRYSFAIRARVTDAVKGRYRRSDTAGSRPNVAGRGSQTGSQLPRPEQAEVDTHPGGVAQPHLLGKEGGPRLPTRHQLVFQGKPAGSGGRAEQRLVDELPVRSFGLTRGVRPRF